MNSISFLCINNSCIITGGDLPLLFPTIRSKPVVTYGKPIKVIIQPIAPQTKPIQYSSAQVQKQGTAYAIVF